MQLPEAQREGDLFSVCVAVVVVVVVRPHLTRQSHRLVNLHRTRTRGNRQLAVQRGDGAAPLLRWRKESAQG